MSSHELIQNLREALKFSPDNAPLMYQLAQLLTDNKLYGEAEEQWKTLIGIEAFKSKALLGLSKVYYLQNQYSTAIVILEDLTQMDAQNKSAWLLYSKALLKEGSTQKAIEAYQKVLSIDPQFTDEELDKELRQSYTANATPQMEEDEVDDIRMVEKPNLKFEDVGGMNRLKEEIELKIIKPMQHPELYKAYGRKIGGGILLYGPPGCGKTYLAKATAGEISAKFISIGINDILDMWLGNSEKNLHEAFELARKNKPCVLFFDEVDALGASRSDMRQSSGRHLINQFLAELDGVKANNDGILVLGATNAPWHLDAAFRRPGRFDRIIFVEPPELESRAKIIEILLKDKPIEKIDYEAIAKKTEEYSGADLKAVVDICIETKLTESFKTGIPKPMTTKDLLEAAKKHKPSTKEWFNSAKNYALYANDSGLYDDILKYLKIKK
jgi:SpoVK/Ycf46/Vps4 family AAA+-type ATPase